LSGELFLLVVRDEVHLKSLKRLIVLNIEVTSVTRNDLIDLFGTNPVEANNVDVVLVRLVKQKRLVVKDGKLFLRR